MKAWQQNTTFFFFFFYNIFNSFPHFPAFKSSLEILDVPKKGIKKLF